MFRRALSQQVRHAAGSRSAAANCKELLTMAVYEPTLRMSSILDIRLWPSGTRPEHQTKGSAMSSFFSIPRVTGLLYLGLAVTGMLSFLIIQPQLFVSGDAAATVENLVAHADLARWGVALELGVVLFQAVLALLFLTLFRAVRPIAATAIAAFGLINAVAILCATMFWSVANGIATSAIAADSPGGEAAATVLLLIDLHNAAWDAGNLFFGLWLIPMGLAVLAAGWVRVLGYALIVGGVGYVMSAFFIVLLPQLGAAAGLLSLLATVGELWIIGYLLFTRTTVPSPAEPTRIAAQSRG